MSQSVAEALHHILGALDVVAEMALDPEDHHEVAAEQIRIGQIISRAQLILSFIETRKPPTKVGGRAN
jgi:hypothetical protein